MKKLITVIAIFALVLTLFACGKKNENVEVDMAGLSAKLADAGLFVDTLQKSDRGIPMNIDQALCESIEYYVGAGATGEEYGLFVCNSADDAKTIVTQLEARQAELKSTYESYAPDAMPRIENAVIKQAGKYVVFVTADKYSEAASIVSEFMDKK